MSVAQQHALHVVDYYLWRAVHTSENMNSDRARIIMAIAGRYSMATFRDLDAEEEAREGWSRDDLTI